MKVILRCILLSGFLLLPLFTTWAQQVRILDSIDVNVHLQVHTSYFSNRFELQENVPRWGTSLYRKVGEHIAVFGRLEYGLNLANGTRFNQNANSPSEFVNDPLQEPEPFTSRLGFVGISHKTLGTLTMGKQWGSYSDVGGFTDAFTVFGSSAVDVYASGTDGGFKGTGRSDETVQYRNRFGPVGFSAQTQFFGSHENYGGALTYYLSEALTLGTGFNLSEVPKPFRDLVENLSPHSLNLIGGGKYETPNTYSGLTFAYIENQFVVVNGEQIITFPVYGSEFIFRTRVSPRIKAETGFNYKWEKDNDTYFNGDYRLLQFYAGMNYYFSPTFSFYLQGRLDDSRYISEIDSANVILIGMSFDLYKGFRLN